ncbi:MAG: CPBP family intramembrane glutamic endopeptidase [Bacteroidales bacterium]
MRYNWFEHSSEGAKFVVSLAAMVGFLAMGIVISAILAIPFLGVSAIKELGNEASASVSLLKFFQAFQSVFLFVLPPFVLALLFGERPRAYLKLSSKVNATTAGLGMMLIVSLLPVINYTQQLNSQLSLPEVFSGLEQWMRATEESVTRLTEKFLSTTSFSGLLINIVIIAIIPAIGEELTFRGLFQNIFTRWLKNYHAGVWLSAALFSFFHFQFFGFLPRLLLGVTFGYVVAWTGYLGYAIMMHFTNNFLGVLAYYLVHRGIVSVDLDNIGLAGNGAAFYLWGSLVVSTLILYAIFLKNSPQRNFED